MIFRRARHLERRLDTQATEIVALKKRLAAPAEVAPPTPPPDTDALKARVDTIAGQIATIASTSADHRRELDRIAADLASVARRFEAHEKSIGDLVARRQPSPRLTHPPTLGHESPRPGSMDAETGARHNTEGK